MAARYPAIIGGTRAGKTALAAEMLAELERQGHRVLLVTKDGFRYSDVPPGEIIQGEVVRGEIEGKAK